MYKYRKIISFVLLLSSLFFLFSCTPNTSDGDTNTTTQSSISTLSDEFTPNENMTKLVIMTNKFVYNPGDDTIQNKVNNYLKSLGKDYYIDFTIIDNLQTDEEIKNEEDSQYSLKYQTAVLNAMEKNEHVDLVTVVKLDSSNLYFDDEYFYLNDILLPLDDYLKTDDGKKVYDNIDDKVWELSALNGSNYVIPNNMGNATTRAWDSSLKALEDNNIKPEDLQGELWDIVENEKINLDTLVVESGLGTYNAGNGFPVPPFSADYYYQLLTPFTGINYNDTEIKAINIFEDEFMKKNIKSLYKIKPVSDMLPDDVHISTSISESSDINIDVENSLVNIPINDDFIAQCSNNGLGVSSWTQNKDKALDLLTELNTNKELALLINYGVENENYTINEDDKIVTIESQDSTYSNRYKIFSTAYILPEDEFYKTSAEFENATTPPVIGFVLNQDDILDELNQTHSVYEDYKENLFIGKGDFDTLYNNFIDDLNKAGMQVILEEVNSQLSNYLKENGE